MAEEELAAAKAEAQEAQDALAVLSEEVEKVRRELEAAKAAEREAAEAMEGLRRKYNEVASEASMEMTAETAHAMAEMEALVEKAQAEAQQAKDALQTEVERVKSLQGEMGKMRQSAKRASAEVLSSSMDNSETEQVTNENTVLAEGMDLVFSWPRRGSKGPEEVTCKITRIKLTRAEITRLDSGETRLVRLDELEALAAEQGVTAARGGDLESDGESGDESGGESDGDDGDRSASPASILPPGAGNGKGMADIISG